HSRRPMSSRACSWAASNLGPCRSPMRTPSSGPSTSAGVRSSVQRASSSSRHLVPDLLAPGLDLVFCGTAPSPASFKARAYYANPGNAFWATLHAVRLTPERLTPQRYPELLAWRIGLTDLNKTEYGSDHELSAQAMDAKSLHAKLA